MRWYMHNYFFLRKQLGPEYLDLLGFERCERDI